MLNTILTKQDEASTGDAMRQRVLAVIRAARGGLDDDAMAVLRAEREWNEFVAPAIDMYRRAIDVHRDWALEVIASRLEQRYGRDQGFWVSYVPFAALFPPGSPLPVSPETTTTDATPPARQVEASSTARTIDDHEREIQARYQSLVDAVRLVRDASKSERFPDGEPWRQVLARVNRAGFALGSDTALRELFYGHVTRSASGVRKPVPVGPARIEDLERALDRTFDEIIAERNPVPEAEALSVPEALEPDVIIEFETAPELANPEPASPEPATLPPLPGWAQAAAGEVVTPKAVPEATASDAIEAGTSSEVEESARLSPENASRRARLEKALSYMRERRQARHHEIKRDLNWDNGTTAKIMAALMRRGDVTIHGQDLYRFAG